MVEESFKAEQIKLTLEDLGEQFLCEVSRGLCKDEHKSPDSIQAGQSELL